MNYILLIYILGCVFSLSMLGKHIVDAWNSSIPKLIVIIIFTFIIGLSWVYYIVQYLIFARTKE